MDWNILVGGAVAVAGGALTIVGGWIADSLRDRRSSDREVAARSAQRAVARDAFQRTTLLDLQEALSDWTRAVMEAHIDHQRSGRESGSWTPRRRLPDELSERLMTLNRRVSLLQSRVIDDDQRAMVKRATAEGFVVSVSLDQDESEAASQRLAHLAQDAIEHAGAMARELW